MIHWKVPLQQARSSCPSCICRNALSPCRCPISFGRSSCAGAPRPPPRGRPGAWPINGTERKEPNRLSCAAGGARSGQLGVQLEVHPSRPVVKATNSSLIDLFQPSESAMALSASQAGIITADALACGGGSPGPVCPAVSRVDPARATGTPAG